MQSRVCSKTGFALIASPGISYRIAKTSYGPLDPKIRNPNDVRQKWSRYDTVGKTIYAASERSTVFMEMLAPYRATVNQEKKALLPAAQAVGMDLEDYWALVLEEWSLNGNMHPNWLPASFRSGRAVYTLNFPEGWWIDIKAFETLDGLKRSGFLDILQKPQSFVDSLNTSHLTSDDRVLTTLIAEYLKSEILLDDGTRPMGIRFYSKHGHPAGDTGECWAYWQRFDAHEISITGTTSIEKDDPDFVNAQRLTGIKVR